MTDITLKTIASGYNLNKINDNFVTLEDNINNTSIQSTGGNNVMSQDFDMNSKRMINLPAPVSGSEPIRKGDITASTTGATVQYVDDSIEAAAINDLSVAYTFKTVALMQASTIVFPVGKKIVWQGYTTESDGGSNWGLVAAGVGINDGGSEFTLADGQHVVANLKGAKILVNKFGAVGDADATLYTGTDDTLAIQAALDYAESLPLFVDAPSATALNFGSKGGTTIKLGSKAYLISQIEIPNVVSFIGNGKNSSLLVSNFNGQIVRNKLTAGTGFDKWGTRIANFSIQGDRTKVNQVGLDTLRYFDNLIENITISLSGGRGLVLRQAITTTIRNITTSNCVGAGIIIDQGINSWDDPADNGLPANANSITDCHSFANDGAGLLIEGLANGNIVKGGSYENNYLAGGTNVGYNIEITAQTFAANTLDGVWTEGPAKAHVYMNAATTSSSLEINNWKNISNGSAGHVDRALIVDKGEVRVNASYGQAQSYVNIGGSVRPFRRNVASGNAILRVTDASGSTITDGIFVETEANIDDSGSQQENLNRAISGVKFDSTFASTDVNTLDDYEEGTWTPTLETDGTNFTTVTYDALTQGTYVKIGKLVTLTGAIRTDLVTKGGANGNVVIGGLPFVAGSIGTTSIATSSSWLSNHPSSGYMLSTASTMFLLYRATSNGATSNLQVADVGTGANANLIRFTASYEA